MIIKILAKSVYGNQALYPNCEKSKLLAKLAGTKTLTKAAIDTIKELGYEIEFNYVEVKI